MPKKIFKLTITSLALSFLGLSALPINEAVSASAADVMAPEIIAVGEDAYSDGDMANLPAALTGEPYQKSETEKYKVTAIGSEPLTYSVRESGYNAIPAGLHIDSVTGEFYGVPTVGFGNYGFTITVTNPYGSASALCWINVFDETAKPVFTTDSLPDACQDEFYCENVSFDGYYQQFTCYVKSGHLPEGLEFKTVGVRAELRGTPREFGTFTFVLGIDNTAGICEKEFTLVIEERDDRVAPTILSSMQPLGGYPANYENRNIVVVGQPFEYQLESSGSAPIEFFIYKDVDEVLEANENGEYELGYGMYLTKSGKVYGTPTEAGHISTNVGARNERGNSGVYNYSGWGTATFYFTIYNPGTVLDVSIEPSNTSVPKGGKRQFSANVVCAGENTSEINWYIDHNGPIQSGTKIDSNGLLSIDVNETNTSMFVYAYCGGKFSNHCDIELLDHVHTTTMVEAKDKTCTANGNIEYFECTTCGEKFSDAEAVNSVTTEDVTIPASHELGQLVEKEYPTCSKQGFEEHYQCSVCNQYFDKDKNEKTFSELTIDYNNTVHSFGAWIEEVPATCVSTGVKAHKVCNDCHKNFDASNNEIEDLTIAIDNTAHSFVQWVDEVPATCSSAGTKAHKDCVFCNKHFDSSNNEIVDLTIPNNATAHSFGSWIEEVPATCSSKGTKGHKDCTLCNKHFDTNGVEITDLVIDYDNLVHSFGAWIEEVPATCVSTGVKGHKVCNDCHKNFDQNNNEITDLTIAINEDAHSYGEWINEVPATCSVTGTKGYKQCNDCHKNFDDQNNELTDLVIPTNDNHDFEAAYTSTAQGHYHLCKNAGCPLGHDTIEEHTPNRTEATETEAIVCTVCGYVIEPAKGHTHNMVLVPEVSATCTQNGKKQYYKCSGCELKTEDAQGTKEITDDSWFTIPGGHNYSEWHEEVPATYNSNGTKGYYSCSGCNKYFDTNHNEITDLTINQLVCSHNALTKTDEVKATTDSYGVKEYYTCNDCGKTFADNSKTKEISNLDTWKNGEGRINKLTVENPTKENNETVTPEPEKGLSGGAVAGIVIGSIVVVAAASYFVLGFLFYKKGKLSGKFFDTIFKWIKK